MSISAQEAERPVGNESNPHCALFRWLGSFEVAFGLPSASKSEEIFDAVRLLSAD